MSASSIPHAGTGQQRGFHQRVNNCVVCISTRSSSPSSRFSLSLSLPSRLSVVAQHARPGHRGAPCRRQIRQSALSSLALVACAHLASTPSGQNHLGRASAHGGKGERKRVEATGLSKGGKRRGTAVLGEVTLLMSSPHPSTPSPPPTHHPSPSVPCPPSIPCHLIRASIPSIPAHPMPPWPAAQGPWHHTAQGLPTGPGL